MDLTLVMGAAGFPWEQLPGEGIEVLARPGLHAAREHRNIVTIVSASALETLSDFIREANRLHHLQALLIHADLNELWIPQLLELARVKTLRNTLMCRDWALALRVIRAWHAQAAHQLIADALVLEDRILVMSCALQRLEVPLARIPELAQSRAEARREMVVDQDGSYLLWPTLDLHLSLESLQMIARGGPNVDQLLARLRTNARLGQAIRSLRRDLPTSSSQVPGLSTRQLARIEAGLCSPRAATLEALARAHELSLKHYLDALADHLDA